jgi:hypothetical protein
MLLNVEDSISRTVVPRLKAAGADLSLVHVVDGIELTDGTSRMPRLPDDIDRFEQLIKEHEIRMVIIDPFLAFLNPSINSWSDQGVRTALAPLSKMAERLNVAVLLVRHPTKNSEHGPMQAGAGSMGIIASARAGFYIGRIPHDQNRMVIAPVKNNLSRGADSLSFELIDTEHGCAAVRWLGPSELSASDLRPRLNEMRPPRDSAKAFLTAILRDGPLAEPEVKAAAERQGISESTLKRAKHDLGVISKRNGFGSGCHWLWSLPEPAATNTVEVIPFDTAHDHHEGGQDSYSAPQKNGHPGTEEAA